ncbi:YafY family protein [uncultured Ruminococcus sp.]|uniref:helix-turn-helix transcriptional regulator n=1 Tax=uncultured Ruminococcus sp. TaxID=165186 RepID=UPI0025D5BB39|nr:WYL domain-containing protein [uncultured Ruminococcus sp.]
MTDNCQKIKLVKLLELLRQETDEEHPMKTNDICSRLEQMGISSERRTLAMDISMLNDYGYEVMSCRIGKSKAYYIEDRSFSIPELKVLIDAVQGSNSITEKKSEELITKLADLSGSHRSALLKRNAVKFNTIKHTNERIYYTIDQLEKALRTNQKICIVYYHLDENGKKIYHTEGGVHIVEPISLIYDSNEYYLTCYDAECSENRNYRLDRIERVELLDDVICDETRSRRRGIARYKASIFRMYGGDTENVTLEFDRSVIESIYDTFGLGTKIRPCGEWFSANVDVQISPTFWGWVFQFAGKMRILEPTSVKEKYLERLQETINFETE